jgi:RHS repeat-associated protein
VRYTSANSTLPTRYAFTGQYSYVNDEATDLGGSAFGLMYFGARFYDPALGRFSSADTIIPEQSQGVQAWDRYAFVNNNPVRYNDPTGHFINFVAGAFIGGLIGGGSYLIGAAISGRQVDPGQLAVATAVGVGAGLLVATGVGAVAGGTILASAIAGAGVGAVTAESAYNLTAGDNYNTGDMLIASGAGLAAGAANGAIGASSLAGTTTGFVAETLVNGTAGGSQHLFTGLYHGRPLDESLLFESATVGAVTAGTTGVVNEISSPYFPSLASEARQWSSPYLSRTTTAYIQRAIITQDAINGFARGIAANLFGRAVTTFAQ